MTKNNLLKRVRMPAVVALTAALTLPSTFSAETPEQWYAEGQAAVAAAKKIRTENKKAKNVILFIGDGMGVSTVTAARILAGQLQGNSGEENSLSFEKF